MPRPIAYAPHFGDALPNASRAAAAAGFDGLELPVIPQDEQTSAALLAEVDKQLTADGGSTGSIIAIRVACPIVDGRRAASLIAELLPMTQRLDACCVNVSMSAADGQCGQGQRPSHVAGRFCYAAALDQSRVFLREIRHEAETWGVPVAIAPNWGEHCFSPVEMREMIDDAASWAVGVCVELGRAMPPETAADWLTVLHRRMHCVRVVPPGKGEPMHAAIAQSLPVTLDEIRYAGPIVLTGDIGPDDVSGWR